MNVFAEEKSKLTLGIIGGYIGKDKELINVIKANLPLFELANHGLNAKNSPDGKSLLLTQPIAISWVELSKANSRIRKIFNHKASIFIPHQNEFNEQLLSILGTLGLSYISSSCLWHNNANHCHDKCSRSSGQAVCGEKDNHGIIHAPAGASTQWEPEPGKGVVAVERVLQEVENSISQYGFAVVMLHPQDFVDRNSRLDISQLQQLRILLRTIKSNSQQLEILAVNKIKNRCS